MAQGRVLDSSIEQYVSLSDTAEVQIQQSFRISSPQSKIKAVLYTNSKLKTKEQSHIKWARGKKKRDQK